MPMGKHHEHAYTLKVIDVIADNPRYDSEKYGFKSLLVQECGCAHIRPVRYGERKAIHKVFDEMQAKQPSEGKTE